MSCLPGARFSVEGVLPAKLPSTSISQFGTLASMVSPEVAAAVAPPTFVLFTDRDVKLHFAFERFLANQIRAAFGFISALIWFKLHPRNKKKPVE
jgi:hypothetical protein